MMFQLHLNNYIMLLLFLLFMQSNFEVLKTDDPQIRKLIQNSVSVEVCDFNQADIFHLSDGRYLIRPKVMGKYILLYNERELMDEHIKRKYFPINDFEVDEILEKERENIENIENSIGFYVKYIQLKFKLGDLPLEKATIKILNEKVTTYGVKNLTDYDILSLSLFVNEVFRRETSTNWCTMKINTLNPYFQPLLTTKSGKILYVRIIRFIKEYKICDLELCYSIEYDRFTGNEPLKVE